MRNSRLDRILYIQQVLVQGGVLNKQQTADRFGVSEKPSSATLTPCAIILQTASRAGRSYTTPQRAAICWMIRFPASSPAARFWQCARSCWKAALWSRRRCSRILDKLILACTPLDRLNQVKDLISNERFHYVEPQHGRKFIESLWEIGTAIENHNVMEITYCRTHDGETRVRTIEPVGILFSEYYFYLAAFIEGIDKDKHFRNPQDNSPTIYRIDRIQNYKTLERHFAQRYTDRFQEGEMRKRIQFMYGGELQTIRFEYTGPSLESVLDRLPTAKVLQVTEKGWIVEAEVFGTGIDMWVRSQGDYIKIINT